MKPDFLNKPSLDAAPLLLGWKLCRQLPGAILKIKIVETEAYHQDDPASHSFRGLTVRTQPMFEAGGRLYIYFTYGLHYCLNIVTGRKGVGEGVLVRAGEPLDGLEIMKKNRQVNDPRNLTNGPGKLAQALGIFDTKLSGSRLGRQSIWLEPPSQPVSPSQIWARSRIGITKARDKQWRFYIKDNPFVSRLSDI